MHFGCLSSIQYFICLNLFSSSFIKWKRNYNHCTTITLFGISLLWLKMMCLSFFLLPSKYWFFIVLPLLVVISEFQNTPKSTQTVITDTNLDLYKYMSSTKPILNLSKIWDSKSSREHSVMSSISFSMSHYHSTFTQQWGSRVIHSLNYMIQKLPSQHSFK